MIAGTYFGHLFPDTYVQRRLAEAIQPVVRVRWQGLQSWPGVAPEDIQCPMLVYTGTADGNVVGQLQQQRAAIEAAGMYRYVFNNLRHSGPVSAVDVRGPTHSAVPAGIEEQTWGKANRGTQHGPTTAWS